MVNVVPSPTSESTPMVPPWLEMMPETIESPSPVLLSLVVKNGSKIRRLASGGMPVPVSVTERRTQSCS